MTAIRYPALIALFLGYASLSPSGHAQPSFAPANETDGSTLVRLSAVAEREAVSAAQPTDLAITLAITEGWHVYWKNPGDTGAQVRVNYQGPEWATLGELRWPVPQRYTSPGDLLDFVHEGEATLLAPLRIDEEGWIKAGRPDTLRFTLASEWFVCKEVCLMGEGSVTLSIPVRAEGDLPVDARHAKRFSEARAKLPIAVDEVKPDTYKARFEDGVLHIAVPGASQLTFFPGPSDVLAVPVDALGEAQKQGERLSIRYRDAASSVEHLEGVLVIEMGQKDQPGYSRQAVEVRVPVKATSRPE